MTRSRKDRLKRTVNRLLLTADTYDGHCFRCMKPKFGTIQSAISGEGSRLASGRFHVQGKYLVVYTGTTYEGAQWEYFNTARSSGIDVAHLLPVTVVSIQTKLTRVLNLTDLNALNTLRISIADVRDAPWNNAVGESLTQFIGHCAYDAGFEAIRAPSLSGDDNLNVFPAKLLSSSVFEIINPGYLPPP